MPSSSGSRSRICRARCPVSKHVLQHCSCILDSKLHQCLQLVSLQQTSGQSTAQALSAANELTWLPSQLSMRRGSTMARSGSAATWQHPCQPTSCAETILQHAATAAARPTQHAEGGCKAVQSRSHLRHEARHQLIGLQQLCGHGVLGKVPDQVVCHLHATKMH